MILRAIGNDASIELFEHHLVITRRRPGFITDRPSAEQFIPLSSIKSVQFIRPGFMARGIITLTLEGSQSNRAGTSADENSVSFLKGQLTEFERLLHAIREAIATPSIERMAMAAQRRQSVGSTAPPQAAGRAIEAAPQPNTQGSSSQGYYDQTTKYDRDGYATNGGSPSVSPPGLGGWWRDMPLLGKVIFVGLTLTLLVSMCSSGTSSPDESADVSSTEASSPPGAAGSSADAMLSDWSEFATGEPRTSQFAMTDGSGTPGEFCNASDGERIMTFGSPDLSDGLKVYDMFSDLSRRSDTGYMGAFWFDRASGELRALRMAQKKSADRPPEKVDDFTMQVVQVSPGVVSVDGTNYHLCVI